MYLWEIYILTSKLGQFPCMSERERLLELTQSCQTYNRTSMTPWIIKIYVELCVLIGVYYLYIFIQMDLPWASLLGDTFQNSMQKNFGQVHCSGHEQAVKCPGQVQVTFKLAAESASMHCFSCSTWPTTTGLAQGQQFSVKRHESSWA